MTSALWNIVFFIISLGVLVAIHELGHFLAARRFGVRVYRFSIGMGPVIYKRRMKSGTEFAISAIPMGGYCSMKGEGDDRDAPGAPVDEVQPKDASASAGGGAADGVADEGGVGAVSGSGAGSEDRSGDGDFCFDPSGEGKVSRSDGSEDDNSVWSQEMREQALALGQGQGQAPGGADGASGGASSADGSGMYDEDSFAAKTVGQRAMIVAAGPVFNIVLAVVLYTAMNMVGIRYLLPVVGAVAPDTLASAAALRDNDLICSVDGTEVRGWNDVISELMTRAGSSVQMEVAGDLGRGQVRTVELDLSSVRFGPREDTFGQIGFQPSQGRVSDGLTIIKPDSPADIAGLKVGDRIVAINGQTMPNWFTVTRTIAAFEGGSMEIEVVRDGRHMSFTVVPEIVYDKNTGQQRQVVGFGVGVSHIPELVNTVQHGPVDALTNAIAETGRMSMLILEGARQMITGALSTENISGPITIARGAGVMAQIGLSNFLWFMATLSVNLGILNLLPVPVLDGGQLVFLTYEKVTGRRPNVRLQRILTAAGMAILLSLTMLAIFNDIASL